MKHFEQMASGEGEWTGVLVDQGQILFGHLPDGRLDAGEQSRIGQVAFGRHDGVDSGGCDAPLNVGQVLNVAVGDHRDVHRLPVSTYIKFSLNFHWSQLESLCIFT